MGQSKVREYEAAGFMATVTDCNESGEVSAGAIQEGMGQPAHKPHHKQALIQVRSTLIIPAETRRALSLVLQQPIAKTHPGCDAR